MLAAAVPGARWQQARVTGPGGQPVDCPWLELPDGTAVVELAAASGLPLLSRPDPLGAHTTGLGEVIGRALDAGARQVTIALGGSASTDGGTGALAALGARFLDAAGRPLPAGGGALRDLAAVDLTGLRPPPPGGVSCLSDVARAAARPGRRGRGVRPAEGRQPGPGGPARRAAWPGWPGCSAATRPRPAPARPGAPVTGWPPAWGALIAPGAPQLARLAGLDQALAGAGLVITGEGRYDQTSGTGKVAGAVFAAAAAAGVPAALVAGQVAAGPPAGVPVLSLAELAGGAPRRSPTRPGYLRLAGQRLAGRVGRGGIAPINLGGCGRSRCSAAAPTLSWRPRSAPTWANGCARCG